MKNNLTGEYYTSLLAYLFAGCGHLVDAVEKLAALADILSTQSRSLPQLRTPCRRSWETCRSCGHLVDAVEKPAANADTLSTWLGSLPQPGRREGKPKPELMRE